MQQFDAVDPDFESRVRAGFQRQQFMSTLGAHMTKVTAGEVHIEIRFNQAWTQQHEFVHGGVITSIVDSACGFAAFTLMPAGSEVLTVEYKINFLAPARGDRFVGIGLVVKPGRTLTVCSGEVLAYQNGDERLIATMQTTMMMIAR
jgi:uncharacterized protein (TIGR00369 family)